MASVEHDFLEEQLIYKEIKYLNKDIMCLVHKNYFPNIRHDKREASKWLANVPPNVKWIYVEMTDATPQRLFALKNYLISQFKRQLVMQMKIAKQVEDNAMVGLHTFFDMCDIGPQDYKEGTAYKHWQRYNRKLKKRQDAA